MLLADLLKQLREDRKMKQADLAKAIGVSPGMIGHVESGTRSMSWEVLNQAADALHATEDERRRLAAARQMTSDMLASRQKPMDRDDFTQRLDGIEAAIREMSGQVGALARALTDDAPPPKPAADAPRQRASRSAKREA